MKKSNIGMVLSLTAMINSIAMLPAMTADGSVSSTTSIVQSLPDPVTGTTTGDGVTTYGNQSTPGTTGSSTPKVDTEHWPWMEQETPKARWDSLKSEMPAPSKTAGSGMKIEKPIVDKNNPIPPPEPLKPPTGLTPEKPFKAPETATVTTNATTTQRNQPMRLYGRIEQIESRGAPSFPVVLKAETARLDVRQVRPLRANATEFSGHVVSSFPPDYSGNWGGTMLVQVMQADPQYYRVDPAEAAATLKALRVGATGSVNFDFQNLGSKKVSLQPAQVMFMVPSQDTNAGAEVKQMLGGMGGSPFGGMISQMMQGMQVPLIVSYGDSQTQSGMAEGVSGNSFTAHVVKNDIRELAPGVLEQQIVTQKRTVNRTNNQARVGYDETVLRFTQRNAQQMYVQAASVDYDASKHFLMKSVLAGWITKGQVMQTNPMAGMPGMMPGGMGDLQKMLGPGATQPGQMQQIPGLNPDLLKNLFGQ